MVYRLKKQFPDEIIIKAEPKDNDGCIYAWIPARFLKVSKPRKLNLSEEDLEIRRQRAREIRQAQIDEKRAVRTQMESDTLPFTDPIDDLTMEMMEREFYM